MHYTYVQVSVLSNHPHVHNKRGKDVKPFSGSLFARLMNNFISLLFCWLLSSLFFFISLYHCRCLMDKGFVRTGKWFFKPHELEEKSVGNR